ncbi:apolipoprotein N-acyltransferase [Leptospira ognonensis]|uniref:Apolipoprotein N-acyltransferase n=1 Tax=Leptospira ognonensis TaxID=2484945 RepID=A0A4R9K799_9LEPT|nr:nitrilase-related carbon-nitrogen hydrolase [Leptospira ognonensis]TGL62175.1 apolipoprotein N-acyltransferase [Leptospira ognonensis]
MKSIFRYFTSKEGFIAILCYLFTAVFSHLAFAPLSYSYFIWIAPLGLFYIEKKYRGEWKKLLWHGFGFAIAFYAVSFYWIYHMVTVFGGFPWFIATPIFVLSAVFLNLKFPLFLLTFSFLVKRVGKFFPWLASFSMLFAEFFTPQVFPWYFGSVVAENHILSQNAEYASSYGLTVLLFLFSYLLFQFRNPKRILILIKRVRNSKPNADRKLPIKRTGKMWIGFASVLFVFLCYWVNGYYLFRKWEAVSPIGTREVLIVQPNAPLEFRDGRSIVETINSLMKRIDDLSFEGAKDQKVDLIVLPESGVPFFSTNDTEATRLAGIYWEKFESFMKTLALRHKANVFFNELDVGFENDIKTRDALVTYNSSALYNPNGERRGSYQKVFLLIFGEYMPFDWMYALSGQTGKFAEGKSMDLIPYYGTDHNKHAPVRDLEWKDMNFFTPSMVSEYYKENRVDETISGSFLPLICYEVIISEYVRKFKGDPDFIVNVTNDKWYGNTVESFQHHTLGRMRAIEFRKWLVRSTNSGTSVITDHLGRNLNDEFTPIDSSAFLKGTVSIIPGSMTFYRAYGNVLPWFFLFLSALVFGYYVRKSR